MNIEGFLHEGNKQTAVNEVVMGEEFEIKS